MSLLQHIKIIKGYPKTIFLFCLAFLFLNTLKSQDTLLLSSGEQISVQIDSIVKKRIYYTTPNTQKNKQINYTKIMAIQSAHTEYAFKRSLTDTLFLLNGKRFLISYDYHYDEFAHVYILKNNKRSVHKAKRKRFHLENIFKIKLSETNEVIQIYEKDSTIDQYLSVADMEKYIVGIRQANAIYKAPKNFTIGYISGFSGGYLGVTWGLIPPTIYGVAAHTLKPNMRQYPISHPLAKDEVFKQGFIDQAKYIQRNQALLGGGLGFVSALLSFQILELNKSYN